MIPRMSLLTTKRLPKDKIKNCVLGTWKKNRFFLLRRIFIPVQGDQQGIIFRIYDSWTTMKRDKKTSKKEDLFFSTSLTFAEVCLVKKHLLIRICSVYAVVLLCACWDEPLTDLDRGTDFQYMISTASIDFCTLESHTIKSNLKYIFVIDKSGSNQDLPDKLGTDRSGMRRYVPLLEFLSQSEYDTTTYYSLINFATQAERVQDFTNDVDLFRELIENQHNPSQVDPPQPSDGGWTNFQAALDEVYAIIDSDIRKAKARTEVISSYYVVFFISDGAPYVGQNNLQPKSEVVIKISQLLGFEETNKAYVDSVQVHTGYYYNDIINDVALDYMQAMAERSNGEFYEFGAGQVIDFNKFSVPERNVKQLLRDVFLTNTNTIWRNGSLWKDTDGDSLSNALEETMGSNPDKLDSDDNGISDGVEYFVTGAPCRDKLFLDNPDDPACEAANAELYTACNAYIWKDLLIFYTSFDGSTDEQIEDSSTYEYHASLFGGIRDVDFAGGILEFNPEDEDHYIELPAVSTLNSLQGSSYSISLWFKPADTPPGTESDNDAAYGLAIKDGYHEGLNYTNENRFRMNHWLQGNISTVTASTNIFGPGEFYHVVGVVNQADGITKLYVNGVLEGRSEWAPATLSRDFGTNPWRIGIANPDANNWRWQARGIFDEVKFFDKDLNEEEVADLYNYGRKITEVSPVDEHEHFIDRDRDLLNDCEERVIIKSEHDNFDSNEDWIPDYLAFRHEMMATGNSHEAWFDADKDSFSNYSELKVNTPIFYNNDDIDHLKGKEQLYQLEVETDSMEQTCYHMDVEQILSLTKSDLIRVYILESTSIIDNKRFMRMAEKRVDPGTMHVSFTAEDFFIKPR